MSETQDQNPKAKGPANTPKGGVKLSDLAKKRAENLRDNLMKRKAQTRARQADSKADNKPDKD